MTSGRREISLRPLVNADDPVIPWWLLALTVRYRTETADSFPELWAMRRIPCALSVRLPPAAYDHTGACDARSTA
jgi:hypothetical protein